MFKKTIATAVAASVIFGAGLSNPVKAAVSSDLRMIPVIVNGQKVKFPDTEPFINTDGRTMVPVRFVSERLGADVTWESDTETAVIKYNGKEIRMPIGSNQVSVNGQAVELDTQAELYEGRTMVPLRFVSEVLGSKVEWDNAAHSVRVTDVLYQNKVDAGQVVLDPWGREYSKNWDANWMKLTDLEGTSFYKEGLNAGKPNNRDYIGQSRDWDFKKYNDQWAERVRQYYISTLNIDYRTINESEITNAVIGNMSGMSNYAESQIRAAIKQYVGWVKENMVIARGYADPENSQVRQGGGFTIMRTHFKFMIISATDSAQTFMDNYDVTKNSDSFKLTKNVWYDGYSDVYIATNSANNQWEHYGLYSLENMFMKGLYTYEILN